MKALNLCVSIIFIVSFAATQDVGVDDPVSNDENHFVSSPFIRPTVDEESVFFVDWFEEKTAIGNKWMKSESKKDGTEYNGQWVIDSPINNAIDGDYGLIVRSIARHHAIASALNKPISFGGNPLIVQYEVKYQEGQECGGGYIKLLHSDMNTNLRDFNDKTRYVIMFGPDKCGMNSKIHFIVKHKNPKNGTISEYHAKQPSRPLSSYFDDKKTHLYTLQINSDNTFKISVDNEEINAGNLLADFEPSFTPPKQIYDPNEKKPIDWDDREKIQDPKAAKPEDWDENAPKEIEDLDAQKPNDWLEDVDPLIPDTVSKQPDDWDNEMDGEWEPKKIPNPECSGRSGCGPWNRPMKANPAYKGKWSPPKIDNPNYKGKWSPKLIDNPDYFEADPYHQLEPIGAIGIELWTMSSGIVFDNMIITDNEDIADQFRRETFDVKRDQEQLFDRAKNPQKNFISEFVKSFMSAAEEKPWIWPVTILAILVPIILVSVFCFGRKTSKKVHPKKRDELQQDDDDDLAGDEILSDELPLSTSNFDEKSDDIDIVYVDDQKQQRQSIIKNRAPLETPVGSPKQQSVHSDDDLVVLNGENGESQQSSSNGEGDETNSTKSSATGPSTSAFGNNKPVESGEGAEASSSVEKASPRPRRNRPRRQD